MKERLLLAVEAEVESIIEPVALAQASGLRYVSDRDPGIRRKRHADAFHYVHPNGREISDPSELKQITSLGFPPAWIDVWICPLPNDHIQATGRDTKGRKQYRYHPR